MNCRVYTYKITFDEAPYWYWGVHKEKVFGELYLGSPVTHKWCWEMYTPRIQILEVFECSERGWREARDVEDRLIKPDLNNPFCLNEAYSGGKSIEARVRGGRKGGKAGDRDAKRKNGLEAKKELKGIHAPGMASKGGITTSKLHPEHCSEIGRLGAKTQHQQKWRCLVTGHVTTPAPLSRYQKARGINTQLRERLK
jgi:hypothetical protein